MPSTSDSPAGPTYLLLGPPGIRSGAGVRILRGRRQNILFAMLALRPGVPVETDHLLHAMWEDELPADPAGALQSQVSRLRNFLGGPLVFGNGTYELSTCASSVDLHLFEDLVRQSRQLLDGGAYALARQRVERALSLWRGSPFPELVGTELATDEGTRLEELRLEGLVIRIESDLALGRTVWAVISLRSLIAAYPLREDLWGLLVRGLYLAGRTADALTAYRTARATVIRELGLEPGPLLHGLEAAILRRDPDLHTRPHPCAAHAQLLAATPTPTTRLDFPSPNLVLEVSAGWSRSAAVRLFLDRVRYTLPEYDPDLAEAVDIVRLSRLLEGDPLRIELAAGQLPSRTVRELVELHERAGRGPTRRLRPG